MRGSIIVVTFALLAGVATPSAAQTTDPVLTQYLAVHAALAAGSRDAASTVLAALAAASADTTIVSRAQAASRETNIAAMRRAFRDLSFTATRWTLPDGIVVFYCVESDEGRGAFWLQRRGQPVNPYEPGSPCGSETSVERLSQESSVVGYLDTYGRPDSFSATRLDASVMDIPLAVTPITRDLLDDRNALDVNDAVRSTSTTTPITGFDLRPNFYVMRGFYVFNYRDGIRNTLDGGAPINAASLERVEVLRGPSSILYGKGEPGGLVNFTTKRPVPVLGGSAAVNFGSNGLVRGDFDVTGPLGGGAAGRLIVSGYDTDSHRDSVESGATYINPSIAFGIGSRATARLTGEYFRYHYVPDFGVLIKQGGDAPSFFTPERFMGDAALAKASTSGLRFSSDVDVKMTTDWDLRFVFGTESTDQKELVSFMNVVDGGTTGYLGLVPPSTLLRLKFDEKPHRHYDYGRVENVFRFAHGTGAGRVTHQLLAAADYRRDREELDTNVADHDVLSYVDGSITRQLLGFIPIGQGLIYKQAVTSEATQSDLGVAAQDLIAIGTRVNVLAGLRFESNRIDTVRKGTEQTTAVLGGPVISLDAAPATSESNSVAPRLGVVFKATPRLSVYSSYLTAFISPVPGLLTRDGKTLTPEHSRQLEGGVKATLRRDRVFLTGSLYKTVKDDAFVFSPGFAENAGREESSGMELELTGSVTPQLSLIAGYTFTDMEFTESSPELKGKTRPGVPRHAFSSWARYELTEGRARGLSVGGGVSSIGKVFASYPNTAELDGVTTLDAMVGYEHQQWRIQFNAMNLTSALGYRPSGGFFAGSDPNTNPMSAVPMAPRRFITHLSYRF